MFIKNLYGACDFPNLDKNIINFKTNLLHNHPTKHKSYVEAVAREVLCMTSI